MCYIMFSFKSTLAYFTIRVLNSIFCISSEFPEEYPGFSPDSFFYETYQECGSRNKPCTYFTNEMGDFPTIGCIYCPYECSYCFKRFEGPYYYDYTKRSDTTKIIVAETACTYYDLDRFESPEISRNGPFHCKKVGCSNSPCENNANCIQVFYSFFCKCDNTQYYGRTCNSLIKPDWRTKLATGVHLWYPRNVVMGFYFPFMVTIDNAGDEDAILIVISTSKGYVNVLKKQHKNLPCTNDPQKCRCTEGCNSVYSGTLFIATRNLKNEYLSLPVAGNEKNIIGYIDRINIKAYNQKFLEGPVFEARENVFVRTSSREVIGSFAANIYQQICSLSFQFSDQSTCEPNYDEKHPVRDGTLLFSFANDEIIIANLERLIRPEFFIDYRACGDSLVERWEHTFKIFSVEDLPYVHDHNIDKMAVNEECKTPSQSKECVLPRIKLKTGMYMMKAEGRAIQRKGPGRGPYNGFHICYFNFRSTVPDKMIVKIEADPEISIGTKDELHLAASCNVKSDITWVWTCERLSGAECPKKMPKGPELFVLPGDFEEGTYKITVTTTNKDKTDSASNSVVLKVNSDEKPPDKPVREFINILCTENCLEYKNPGEDIVMQAVEGAAQMVMTNVTWKVFEGKPEEGKELTLKDIVSTDRPPRVEGELVISQEKLEKGKTYTIVASGLEQEVQYTFTNKISTPPTKGTCKLTPEKGIRGYDYFAINCTGWEDEYALTYEFFDKEPNDLGHYVGRLMGFSQNGRFSPFRLTRGLVVMYAVNHNGLSSEFTIKVELTDMENETLRMQELRSNFSQQIKTQYLDKITIQKSLDALRTASVIAEVLTDNLPVTDILTELITNMVKIPMDNSQVMKLGLSTILIMLTNGFQRGKYKLDHLKMKDVAKVLLELSRTYKRVCCGYEIEGFKLRRDHIHQLSRHFLDSIDAAILSRDEQVILSPEEDVSYKVIKNLHRASEDIYTALRLALLCVGYAQLPGTKKTEIVSKEKTSTMTAMVDYLQTLADAVKDDPGTSLLMPPKMVEGIRVKGDITLQYSVLKENLFWWAEGNITSDLVVVELHYKSRYRRFNYLNYVPYPVTILLKVKTIDKGTFSGTATQIDLTLDEDTRDLQLLVYRILPPPLAKLYLQFNFTESKSSLRVLVLPNRRPDWNLMEKKSKIVEESNPIYKVPYAVSERQNFYYMGIMPASDVPINSSVDYTFEIYYVLCQVWASQWINHYCLVGANTTESTVECKCSHFSLYASTIGVPPNEINPILDAHLFLDVLSNPWVVLFVALLLLFFLLAILWAAFKDKKDKLSMDVIVLDDNYPGDSFGYLIAVHTGARFTAGTTANVGLRLYGNTYASRPHILSCSTRKVLQRDNDDWFLLCYPVSLGVLHSVQLWHDHTGRSPDWFCSKVVVYDLIGRTQYIFLVEQWLALEINEFPESVVRSATADEILSVKRLFLDNSDFGFRENHTWLSVFARHPRSAVSRKERLTVLMVCVMVSMLTSIMFFKVSDKLVGEMDQPHFSVGMREVIVSIESFIVTSVITLLVLCLFKRSYKQKKYTESQKNTLYTPTRKSLTDPSEFWLSDKSSNVDLTDMKAYSTTPPKNRKDMTFYENIVKSIRKLAAPKKLKPVLLSNQEDTGIVVRKGWLIAAWIVSISVIAICSYLVMLYSLKFGKVKSQLWLSSLVMTLGQDIFLLSPIKIIFFAVILSIAFERMVDIASFRLNVKDAIKIDLVGNEKYLLDLCERRAQEIYYPISDERKQVLRQKHVRKMRWRTFLDFIMVLLFIFVLCLVMKNMWSGSHYTPNAHSIQLVATPNEQENIAITEIFNRTDFTNYLSSTFVAALYSFRWFNDVDMPKLTPEGKAFRRKDWSTDFTTRLMGIPRLRQLRVKPDRCQLNNLIDSFLEDCILPWSERNCDNDDYSISWHKSQYVDLLRGFNYWKYNEAWNSSAFSLPGKTSIVYPTGGYIAELATTRAASVRILADLRESKWQDVFTRVTFVTLTLYNVNNHLFSQVTLVVEHMQFGNFLILSNAESVHIREEISIWNAGYIIFIFILLLRIIYKINRNGFLYYLAKPLNIYELFVIVLGVLSVTIYLTHLHTSSVYVEKYQQRGLDSFFNFKEIIYYFLITKVFLWLLFCFSVFRLFISWRFGNSYYFFFYTFLLSGRWLVLLVLLFLLYFFVLWRIIGYLIDALVFSDYRIVIMHYQSHGILQEKHIPPRTETVLFLLCIVAKCAYCLTFIFFTYYYKLGRNRLIPPQNFSFISFIAQEFQGIFRKKKAQKKRNLNEIRQ